MGCARRLTSFTAEHSLNISSLDTRIYAGGQPETTAANSNANDAKGDTFTLEAVVTSFTAPDKPALAKAAAALAPLQMTLEWIEQ